MIYVTMLKEENQDVMITVMIFYNYKYQQQQDFHELI